MKYYVIVGLFQSKDMVELATVKGRQTNGSVKSYVEVDLKQEIALKLPEEITNFPMEEAEGIAEEGEAD